MSWDVVLDKQSIYQNISDVSNTFNQVNDKSSIWQESPRTRATPIGLLLVFTLAAEIPFGTILNNNTIWS